MAYEDIWRTSLGAQPTCDPIIVGDVLVVATPGVVVGLDIYSKAVRWKHTTTGAHLIAAIVASGNRVFFLGNRIDFAPVTPSNPSQAVLEDDGGGIFSGGGGGAQHSGRILVVLDAGTGAYCDEWLDVVPADDDLMDPWIDTDVLMLRTSKGMLSAYDAKSGTEPALLWSMDAAAVSGGADTPSPAGLGDDAAFFVMNGRLLAINLRSGELRWTFPSNTVPDGEDPALYALENGDSLNSADAPMVGKGLVLLVSLRRAYALDWRSGARMWDVDGASSQLNKPVVSWGGDCVFFSSQDGHAHGHHLGSGEAFWNFADTGETITTGFLPPVINTDVVEIDAESGHLETEDRVFITTQDGNTYILAIRGDHTAEMPQYQVVKTDVVPFGTSLQRSPLIANSALISVDSTGAIDAKSFSTARVAYFDGDAHIEMPKTPAAQFGKQEFALEAWVRTTMGGDVVTQSADATGTGFRMRIVNKPDGIMTSHFGAGCVQFTVFNAAPEMLLYVQTMPTQIADGRWHHVSLHRRGNGFTILVDGQSQPVETLVHRSLVAPNELSQLPPATQAKFFALERLSHNVAIADIGTAGTPLMIGKYVASSKALADRDPQGFQGLIADVRMWDRALPAKKIRNNMTKLLTGHEPGLISYFPLNQPDATAFKDTTNDQLAANVVGATAILSNLALDDSLFPYLLNAAEVSWPYSERWTVRAEDAPKYAPTGGGEVVCFATDRALYAVDTIHGTRKWGVGLEDRSSPPTADKRTCFVINNTVLEARGTDSGKLLWTADLGGGTPVQFAPILVPGYVVATLDGQTYTWFQRGSGKPIQSYDLGAVAVTSPVASGPRLYVADGTNLVALEMPEDPDDSITAVATIAMSCSDDACLAADASRVLVFDGSSLRALDAATITQPAGPKKFAWNPPQDIQGVVTGAALAGGLDTTVVTTSAGEVHFLEYGSGRRKSLQRIDDTHLFAPVREGHEVYVCAAAKPGTTGKSGVQVFDIKSGHLRAVDVTDAPPTGSPYVATGSVFFGLDNKGPAYPKVGGPAYPKGARLDGEALHSVIFGSNCAVLREKGDTKLAVSGVDVAFDGDEARPLGGTNVFEDGVFTIEAWVNSDGGAGGQVAFLPSKNNAAGFELSVGAQGEICAKHLKANAGSSFTSAPSSASDGSWHHIAAVFRHNNEHKQQMCYLYLDGKPLAGVSFADLSVTAQSGDRALAIGGEGANTYCGMLDEIRVWGTWIPAAELLSRRNVRLRGNEPDLLAAWFFDDTGLHDCGPHKLHAVSNNGEATLKLRLTDLSFTKPTYPYLFAKSAPGFIKTQTKPNGNGETITTALFNSTVSARRANGTGIGGSVVRIWASEVTQASASNSPTQLTLGPDQPQEFTLDDDGNLDLTLSNTNVEYSPVLWVHADFMYPNERFHVSAVAESNDYVTVSPPHLVAQSSMLQDMAYAPGDSLGTNHGGEGNFTVHSHADITTIHTTFKAVTVDGQMMPNELIELYADRETEIEFESKKYRINKENSHKFRTGPDGALTVTLHEDCDPQGNLLDCPALLARAGFMSRNARFVVNPGEHATHTLATVDAKQITGTKEQAPGEQKKVLVTKLMEADPSGKTAADQAPGITGVLNQMASLAKTHQLKSGLSAGVAANAGPGALAHSGAEPASSLPYASDAVQALHATAHHAHHTPLTPEYMPFKHFVISVLPDGTWTHKGFDTTADLDQHVAGLNLGHTTSKDLFESVALHHGGETAGWFWDDIAEGVSDAYHAVKHGVEHAWNAAKHFVVKTWDELKHDVGEIVHQVEVVVADAAKAIGKWVVKTVKDVVDHVVSFLKKVLVVLKDIYNFVKSLFDWSGILDVHNVLSNMMNGFLDGVAYQVEHTIPDAVDSLFTSAKDGIADALGVAKEGDALDHSDAKSRQQPTGMSAHCVTTSKSGKSQYVQTKMKNHGSEKVKVPILDPVTKPSVSALGGDPGGNAGHAHFNEGMAKLLADGKGIMNQPGGLSKLTTKEMLVLLDDVINVVIDVAEDFVLGLVSMTGKAVKLIKTVLNHELDIPFVSELYKLITGNPLTLLDVMSLLLAVPVHVVSATLGLVFDKNDVDAELNNSAMFKDHTPAVGEAGMGNAHSDSIRNIDICYIVATIISGGLSGVSDIIEGEVNMVVVEGEESRVSDKAMEIMGILSHYVAITAALCQFAMRQKYLNATADRKGLFIAMSYMGIIGPLIRFCLSCYGIYQLAKLFGKFAGPPSGNIVIRWFVRQGDRIQKQKSRFETPVWLTLLGVGLTVMNVFFLVMHLHETGQDKPTDEAKAEDVINLVSSITTALSFLNCAALCKEEVMGVAVFPAVHALIDVSSPVFQVVYHCEAGYGKVIHA